MPDKTLKAKVIVSLDELSGISFTTDINTWYPNDVEVLTNLATLIADLKNELNTQGLDLSLFLQMLSKRH